ncbi:hypothetical protein C7974DRAFT_379223 [Boeremia exigua]|uniref:uncharacterized protein n=1 Tax=Boeremia exigua TaxID=749465 RepID=UPI001E8E0380|nr:uncharacterized protein C7974DRAFT_379223 [Boeremia exigua]KAH6616288.1 hypothetical protein C7974DRAFT_379223 [Boeremia exigua]
MSAPNQGRQSPEPARQSDAQQGTHAQQPNQQGGESETKQKSEGQKEGLPSNPTHVLAGHSEEVTTCVRIHGFTHVPVNFHRFDTHRTVPPALAAGPHVILHSTQHSTQTQKQMQTQKPISTLLIALHTQSSYARRVTGRHIMHSVGVGVGVGDTLQHRGTQLVWT